MIYNFIFEPDYPRIMMACIIDGRASIPQIKNKTGFEIKAYIDDQIALINLNTIVYKIETDLGVLAGFFAVHVNTEFKLGALLMQELRPAFKGFNELTSQISNFIYSTDWQKDYLF